MKKILQNNLESMFGCPISEMPKSLIRVCQEVEVLIQRTKPHGGLMSTQVLAVLVTMWENTVASEDERRWIDFAVSGGSE